MKRFTLKSFSAELTALALLAIVIIMGACSSKLPTPEEVANKIDAKETLDTKDYTTMIDYCGEYAKKAQQYFDLINAQPDASTPEAIQAAGKLAGIYAEYKYLDMFRDVIDNTEESVMGKENVDKINDYAKYEAFPLPIGAGAALQSPDVVGQIEQMPANDSDGVISEGVGEAVNIDVK